MIELLPLPAFNDNYIWLFRRPGAARVGVVDPGCAEPVLRHLQEQALELAAILITHHHADHIGGLQELLARHPAAVVVGPHSKRIPGISKAVAAGAHVSAAGIDFEVLEVPGHTLEHVAFFHPGTTPGSEPVLFCGDTLFAAGCGRMFEGTPPMMHDSLQRLAALPPATRVCCAHEYTLSNLRFASAVMPGNLAVRQRQQHCMALREAGQPTLPSRIADELATNPFLRCEDPEVVAAAHVHVGNTGASDGASVFGILRRWKDSF